MKCGETYLALKGDKRLPTKLTQKLFKLTTQVIIWKYYKADKKYEYPRRIGKYQKKLEI